MAKIVIQPNPRVNQIFEDLEKYLNFCVQFGYKYDESDLYSNKSYVFRQYTKFITGKPVKDNWEIDGKAELV
jgi:hypothetical protein